MTLNTKISELKVCCLNFDRNGGLLYRSDMTKTAELCLKRKDYLMEKEGQVKSKRMATISKKDSHLLKITKVCSFEG